MTKNKLITIPIEEAKRAELNHYCQMRGIKVSELITIHIDQCLSKVIDIDIELYAPTTQSELNLELILDRLDKLESAITKTNIEASIEASTELGLSNSKLAAIVGRDRSTVSRWASGVLKMPSTISQEWTYVNGFWYTNDIK